MCQYLSTHKGISSHTLPWAELPAALLKMVSVEHTALFTTHIFIQKCEYTVIHFIFPQNDSYWGFFFTINLKAAIFTIKLENDLSRFIWLSFYSHCIYQACNTMRLFNMMQICCSYTLIRNNHISPSNTRICVYTYTFMPKYILSSDADICNSGWMWCNFTLGWRKTFQ